MSQPPSTHSDLTEDDSYNERGGLFAAQPARSRRPAPTWKCEYCGQFYSERTGAQHAYCQQEMDRKDAERMWPA